jgi:FkbM family methyltransferase
MVYQKLCDKLKNENINTIFEVGARDCEDTKIFLEYFKNAKIFCYECNPEQKNICLSNIEKYDLNSNVVFNNYGLGNIKCKKNFFPYVNSNVGASSFLKRIDYEITQKEINSVDIETIENEVIKFNIDSIDLLFMDIQGYELNVLKGCNNFINKIKYIFLEIPNENINRNFLKEGHSKYIDAPSRKDVIDFLFKNNFEQITSYYENELEENVLFKNKLFI